MCIRDRGYVRNYYPELSNTRLGNKLLAGAGVGVDFVTFYNLIFRFNYTINGLGPVSYTHLDVYKRQLVGDRFVVNVKGRNVTMDQIKDTLGDLDLAKLATLK